MPFHHLRRKFRRRDALVDQHRVLGHQAISSVVTGS
jgi:hypothetical protein